MTRFNCIQQSIDYVEVSHNDDDGVIVEIVNHVGRKKEYCYVTLSLADVAKLRLVLDQYEEEQ